MAIRAPDGANNDDVGDDAKKGYGVTTGDDGDDDDDVGIGNNDDVGDDAKQGMVCQQEGRGSRVSAGN